MAQREDNTHLYFRMFTEIGIIAQLSQTWLESVLPEGMSLAQFGVLSHFVRLNVETSSPAKLAKSFQVTKGAMTNTLQRLEAQGYVRMTPDPKDARAKLVEITDAGRRAREHCIKLTAGQLSAMPQIVPPDTARATLPFLEHLRKTLDERRG